MADLVLLDLFNGGYALCSQDVSDALQSPSLPGAPANPSVTVGLSAKNGSASTTMRSDGAPALDQAIAPTWTGAHNFSGNDVTLSNSSLKVNTAGKSIGIKEGSNAKMGVATLALGTVTVNTTAVAADSRIMVTHQNLSGIALFAGLGVSARVAGTSFTITSGNLLDTSTVAWVILDPL